MSNKAVQALNKVRPGNFNLQNFTDFLIRRGPLLLFAILIIVLALGSNSFLSWPSINSSLVQAAPIAIIAMALSLVVMGGGDDAVAGGIDLSLPGSAALATAIISDQLTNQGSSFAIAVLYGLLAAMAVGLVNAVLVSYVGLTSILATLATYVSVVGVVRVLTGNKRIDVTDPTILYIRDGNILGIPVVVVIMLVTFVLVAFIFHRTKYGMSVQAVGGSLDAAVAAGLKTKRIVGSTFISAAVVASIAAVLLVARGSGSSPGMDERLLVDMVLATFVGAAFSSRNVVTVLGSMLGAILVTFMSTGLVLNRINNSWIDGWKGVLILLVVVAAAVQIKGRK
jgi:ribose transport system permease protein